MEVSRQCLWAPLGRQRRIKGGEEEMTKEKTIQVGSNITKGEDYQEPDPFHLVVPRLGLKPKDRIKGHQIHR